mgnify:CR=1 FL=1
MTQKTPTQEHFYSCVGVPYLNLFHNLFTLLAQHHAVSHAGVSPVLHHQLTVDHHVLNALRVLNGIRKGALVDDRLRVEDGDIGVSAFPQLASVRHIEGGSRFLRHLVNSLLQGQSLVLTDVFSQDSGECAVHSGMGLSAKQAVGAGIHLRTFHKQLYVLLRAVEVH